VAQHRIKRSMLPLVTRHNRNIQLWVITRRLATTREPTPCQAHRPGENRRHGPWWKVTIGLGAMKG